jgi:hypothetical protein
MIVLKNGPRKAQLEREADQPPDNKKFKKRKHHYDNNP